MNGVLDKIKIKLVKSHLKDINHNGRLFKRILSKFSKDKIDWDDLEKTLISGDLGVNYQCKLLTISRKKKSINPDDIITTCKEEIKTILPPDKTHFCPNKTQLK